MKKKHPYSFTVACLLSGTLLIGCSSDDSGDDDPGTESEAPLSGDSGTGGSFAAAVDSPVLDFSNTQVFWDMESNSVVSADDDWELAVRATERDYQILVNGGASGNASAGVGVLQVGSAFEVDDPTDTAQVYQYFGDSVSGALSMPGSFGPFEYNVEGNHGMWPTFATYLLKDGSENLYKFQILSNNGEDGSLASGHLVVRYASAASGITTAPLDASAATTTAATFDLINGTVTSGPDWHFAYQRYIGFKLNGGDSGDGGVSGCVAHSYADLYDANGEPVAESFRLYTGDNTLADFESVELAESACQESMAEDAIQPYIESAQWLQADYSANAPVYSASDEPSNGWIIRSAQQTGDDYSYARVRVKELSVDLSGTPVRQLVLEAEHWQTEP
ncbi:MAG: hypothetical protein KDJ38_06510 [Gammaproteobacteria bacterium]|nr:hypothetical protein [Gammaproteobacteria bacterium]